MEPGKDYDSLREGKLTFSITWCFTNEMSSSPLTMASVGTRRTKVRHFCWYAKRWTLSCLWCSQIVGVASLPQISVTRNPSFPFIHLLCCNGLITRPASWPFPEGSESLETRSCGEVDLEEVCDKLVPLRRYDQELVPEDSAFEVNLITENVNKSTVSSWQKEKELKNHIDTVTWWIWKTYRW